MKITEFHKLGRRVQKRVSDATDQGGIYGRSVIIEMAAEMNLAADLLYKSRDFANQFSKGEAKRFKSLGLTKSHAAAVLKLQDKTLQISLLESAAEDGWSVKKLTAKVRAHSDVRTTGGRPVEKKTLVEVVQELRLLCKRSVAYVRQLENEDFYRIPRETVEKLNELRNVADWLFRRILD